MPVMKIRKPHMSRKKLNFTRGKQISKIFHGSESHFLAEYFFLLSGGGESVKV